MNLHRTIDHHLEGLDAIDLTELGRDLHAALEISRRNPSGVDGFPSSASGANVGGGSGGAIIDVPCTGERPCTDTECVDAGGAHHRAHTHPCTIRGEHTHPERATLTSVESAADRLIGANARQPLGGREDGYDRIVREALGHLVRADNALRAARNKLDQLGRLQDASKVTAPDTGCWCLARVGSWEAASYSVTTDEGARKIGSWAYKFHRSNGRLPTVDECKRHVRGEKIYVKAS